MSIWREGQLKNKDSRKLPGNSFERGIVTQRVWMNPILKARPLGSTLARIPHGSGSDGTMGGVPGSARKQPLRRFALQPPPIIAQGFQQRGTEHDISVLTSFPTANVDYHASAVDIGNLQAS